MVHDTQKGDEALFFIGLKLLDIPPSVVHLLHNTWLVTSDDRQLTSRQPLRAESDAMQVIKRRSAHPGR